jgi:RimJ/RimL family protein N-acetyltransferase
MMIVGPRLILREDRRMTDDEDLFRWLQLEEWRYYDQPDQPFRPPSREDFEAWLRQPQPPGTRTWQVDTLPACHIGWISLYQLDEQAGRACIGIALPEPGTWDQGYGTEALQLLLDYLFSGLGLKTVRLQTWTGDTRMRNLVEKCGFREVAHRSRARVSVRGEPLELVEYALSAVEWLRPRVLAGADGR